MAILTTCTLTFIDLNEIHIGDAPANPVENELWFDTTNNIVKKYNAKSKIWEIVNDYTQDIIDALEGLQVSSRNLLASTSYESQIVCTNTSNKTGAEFDFVRTLDYIKDIKNKEITVAFDWELVTSATPSGTFRVQTTGSQYIKIGDIITISKTNYYGTCVFTTTLTAASGITGIHFRTDLVTGTFKITHPRLFYGSKDLGWTQAPEDLTTQFETIINKQADGVYISVADKDNDIKSLVSFDSKKVVIDSANIDLKGYVTITSLSDPSSTTTIDGNLITTDTLSANKIKTGKIQGKNSKSYFDLDNGTFSLANATQSLMTFNGTSLTFQNNVNYNLDKDDFSSNLGWIKNWTEGSTTINSKQVLSPMAFFGTVNASKQATGISLGGALNKIYETEGTYSGVDDGLAGYKAGTKMFHFKTDGTLLIGPNTSGNYLSWDGSNLKVRASSINIGSESVATTSNINDAVNNLQVGGRNLAKETNQGTKNWDWVLGTGGKTITEIDENEIRCCKIVRNSVASTSWSYIRYSNINRSKYIPNRQYTISFEVKASVVTSFYIEIKEGDASNSLCTKNAKTGDTVVGTWTKLSATVTTLSSLPESTSQMLYINGMNSNVDVSYIFRNLIICEGTTPSDWTPAPEDVDDLISEVDGKVISTTNRVSTIETDLNGITQRVGSTESNITGLTTRVSTAENKITDNSIISTVTKSQTDGKNTFIQQSDIKQLTDSWTATFNDGYNQGITTINKDGITVTSSAVKSNTSMSANGFKITKTDTNQDIFKVNSDGTLSIIGNINGGSININNGKFIVDSSGNVTTAGKVIISNEATVPTSTLSGTITSNQLDTNTNNILSAANTNNTLITDNKDSWTKAYSQVSNWATTTPTGTTEFNGNRIKTGTIFAEKIALGDFTNYAELNDDTLSKWGFVSVADSSASNNPWFRKSSIVRDNQISKYYKCNGGETFRVRADISTTVYGQSSSGGTATATAKGITIMLFAKSDTGAISYLTGTNPRVTATSTTTAKVSTINGTITLGSNIREFSVYVQIDGYPTFSGALMVRNVLVTKMSDAELIVDGTITTNHISTVGLNADVIKAGTISADRIDANTIVSKVNGATTTVSGNKIRTGQITANSGGSYLNLDNGSMMLGTTSLTSYLQWTGSALNIKASSLSISGVSAATTTNVSDAKAQAINEASGVKDTRSTNENPTWYITNYPQRTVQEFKSLTILGLTGDGTYGTLETKIPWKDSGGGYPTQTFFGSNADVFTRRGLSGTTWSEWTRKANATQSDVFNALTNNSSTQGIYLNNGEVYLNASMIKTGTLQADCITTETLKGKTLSAGIISGGTITIGSGFKVDSSGKMTATGADITGKITVSSGSSVPTSTLSGTVTSSQLHSDVNKSISDAATSATNANNKIDNLQIGGRNLLLNSTLCYEAIPNGSNFTHFTVNNVASASFTKDNGLHYTATSTNGGANSSKGIKIKSTDFNLYVGDTFTFSVDLKGKFGSSNNGLTVMHASTTNTTFYAVTSYSDSHPTAINEWTRKSKSYTIPSNIRIETDGSFYLYLFFGGGTGSEVDVYVKNVKIEKSDKATDWCPALEETVSSVDTMYYLSTSSTAQSGSSWTTILPSVTANKFIWVKTITTYAAGNSSETTPVLYQPDWVQDWDSTKTTITGTSVLAPKIFAGTKETNGSATGVALGTNVFGTGNDYSGLAGYKAGAKTFHFKTDGTLLIGQNTTGNHISWDGSNLSIKASNINIGTESIKEYIDKNNIQLEQNKQNIRCNDVGMKINYSSFTASNEGELYLHGYNSNNVPTDTNGSIYWNGATLTVAKGMINPDSNVPFNTEVFIFINKGISSMVYGTYYNATNKTWSYIVFIGGTGTSHNFIPDKNHVAIGQLNMYSAESFNSAYLYDTPQALANLTIGSMNLVNRITTVENKTTDQAIITTISSKYYDKDQTNSAITSKGYQTSSQVQQTVDNFKLSFEQSGGTNLLRNSAFKNGQANWSSSRWDTTAGGTEYIEVVYPEYNEWTPANRNSLGACITGLPTSSSGKSLRCGFDSQSFSIKPNTTYTLNCLMAAHRVNNYTIEMLCFDASGNRLSDNTHAVVVTNIKTGGRDRNNWNKIKHTFTTQSNASTCILRAFMNEWNGAMNNAFMWICEPIVTEGDVDIPWTPNADEIYSGITTIDRDGIAISMIDGEGSKGSSKVSYEGIATYDQWGTTKSWFSDDNAYIRELNVDIINNKFLIQCKPRNTNWYVGQNSTGDGTGRDYNNKSNSINSILEYIKNSYGCYSFRQDIAIYCDDWAYHNENIYIGGWIGSGVIRVVFGRNSTFVGNILVEECTTQVILDGQKSDWNNNDGCMWYRTEGLSVNAALSVRKSSVICAGFRTHRGIGLNTYGNPFIHMTYNSTVLTYNCDLVKYWSLCYVTDGSSIFINNTRGDIGMLCEALSDSNLCARSNLPIFDSGKVISPMYDSVATADGAEGYNSLWMPKVIPTPSVPEPVQPSPPTQSWHWSEKTFYFSLSSTTEGSGNATTNWSDKWGQGKWGSYKSHRGHAVPTESINGWIGSNSRNISMILTMTRLSSNHGNYGAVPVPKILQKDGSYWSCGIAFALGNTKEIGLSSGIVAGLSDGSLGELTMWAGTSTNDYSQYNNVSLKVTCEKYY